MTITSSTDIQAGAATKQLQKAEEKAAERAEARAAATADKGETPAVVDETTISAQSGPAEATLAAGPELNTADEALKAAQSISAALAEENSAIANGNPSQISGLLTEFEAA